MNTLTQLLEQNPAVNIGALNLNDPDALSELNYLPDVDRTIQLAWLAGYRRLLRLTDDTQVALALFQRDLHSVFQITERSRTGFIRDHGDDCGGPGPAARIYDRAVARKTQVVHTYAAVQQANGAYYRAGRYDNLSAVVGANFNDVPGYDELFGNLDYCTCPDCRTTFSPAAYYTDLMRMQAKYIEFVGDEEAQKYFALESRRPDLWNIELSCANTHTLVPTIEVVNEVLIASVTADESTDAAAQDKDTEDEPDDDGPEVDKTAALYEDLNEAVYPFTMPFNRPLSEIGTVLARESTDLAQIWERITPPTTRSDANWNKGMQLAHLGLSPERWTMCSKPFNQTDYLQWKAWGYANEPDGGISTALVSGENLMRRAALSPAGLRELVYQGLEPGGAEWDEQAPAFYINKGDTDPVSLITTDDDWTVDNLNGNRTARINMFVRLSRFLGWSFQDLNWALESSGRRDGMPKANSTEHSLGFLAWLAAMRNRRPEWSIEELCAMQGILKNYGTESTPSFQDRVFFNANVPNVRLLADYFKNRKAWQIPSEDPSGTSINEDSLKIQAALAGALAMSVDDLLYCANAAAETEEETNVLYINAENLAVLYRCSRLGRLSGLASAEVFTALALPGAPKDAPDIIFTPIIAEDDCKDANKQVQPVLEWLVAYGDWIRESPLSTYELEYLLTGTSQAPRIRNRTPGPDALKNFCDEFQASMADSLLTPEKFAGALGDTAGFNQYNEEAQQDVFDGLTEAGYIQDGKVADLLLIKQPGLKVIAVAIFPGGTPEDDPVVVELSQSLRDFLKTYRQQQQDDSDMPDLDQAVFVEKTRTIFTAAMNSDYLPALLLVKIVAEYVTDGVVSIDLRKLSADSLDTLRESIAPLLFAGQRAFEDNENFLAKLTEAVASAVVGAFEIQQLTFAQELAALYGLSPGQFTPLLLTLPVYKVKDEDRYVPLRLSDLLGEWDERLSAALAAFQPYVLLTTSLDLSASDLVTIAANPAAFDIDVASPAPSPYLLNDDNVRVLLAFKALQRELDDSQNRVPGYLNAMNAPEADATPEAAASQLNDITGWNEKQILFLMGKFWPGNEDTPRPYATVAGLDLLARWFAECARLDLDASTLYQVYELSDVPLASDAENQVSYEQYAGVAGALWGGLGAHLADDPAELRATRAVAGVQTRDVLAPYVLVQLHNAKVPGLTNLRDLSNYLLLDVEVGAEPETSLIGSAIASVQLFAHRCVNNLEPDIVLLDEFERWWEWLSNYRVWEANRKVFLFPENYIEPELRRDKTPLFSDLENELQSVDLRNPADVNAALFGFLDGLNSVTDLVVMGCGGYDYLDRVNTGEVAEGVGVFSELPTKTFCLVGRTLEEPYSYYYRLVHFVKYKPDAYVPVRWKPWREFPHSPQPMADVIKPVFAFGKWFLFWVEREQTGRTDPPEDEPMKGDPLYTNYSCMSFLDFNGEWSGPEKRTIWSNKDEETSSNVQPYPSYLPGAQLIAVAFKYLKRKSVLFYGNTNGLLLAARYASNHNLYPNGPLSQDYGTSGNLQYSYWYRIEYDKNKFAIDAGKDMTFSAWIKPDTANEENNPFFLLKLGSKYIILSVQDGNTLHCKFMRTQDDCPLDPSIWNYVSLSFVRQKKTSLQATPTGDTSQRQSFVVYRGKTYFTNVDKADKSIQLWRLSDSGDDCVRVLEHKAVPINQVKLIEFTGNLYMYWRTGKAVYIGRIHFATGSLKNIHGLHYKGHGTEDIDPPGMAAGEEDGRPVLYCVYKWHGHARLCRLDPNTGILSSWGDLKNPGGELISVNAVPNLVWMNDALYMVSSRSDVNGFEFGRFDDDSTMADYGPVEFTDPVDWHSTPALLYTGGCLYATTYGGRLVSLTDREGQWNGTVLYDFHTDDVTGTGNAFLLNEQLNIPLRPSKTAIDGGSKNILSLSRPPQFGVVLNERRALTLVPANTIPGLEADLEVEIGHGLGTGDPRFNGFMQNVLLYDRELSADKRQGLFENSLPFLTRDFENVTFHTDGADPIPRCALHYLRNLKDSATERFAVDQPGWAVTQGFGIRLLTGFQKPGDDVILSCYRLNSTATAALGQALFMGGAGKLLSVSSQLSPEIPFTMLDPDPETIPPETWPPDRIDLLNGAMSMYYRELFFFTPFLAASMLKTDRRHAQAKTWYEYIFNPTVDRAGWDLQIEDAPADRYWRYLGLRAGYNPLLAQELSRTPVEQATADLQNAAQLYAYHNDPFDPHAVAGLRPIAYQKTMVIRYIHNLIEWGDVLFRRYTRESLGEAFMLYTMAYDLLGKDPVNLGQCDLPPVETLGQFAKDYDGLKNIPEFLLGLEGSLPESAFIGAETPVNNIAGSYFGLPENEDFLRCWDTIQERLFNISHGLDIDGVRRKAALFEPAINPARLAAGVTDGNGTGSAMSAPQTPVPYYRFSVMIQLARSTTQAVTQFGQSLLAALEKKDAEHLALVYNQNQLNLLQQTTGSRQAQVDSLKESLAAQQYSLQAAHERLDYYTDLIGAGLSPEEIAQVTLASIAAGTYAIAQGVRMAAIPAYSIPTVFGLAAGGMQPGAAVNQGAIVTEAGSNAVNMQSSLVGTFAGFARREEEWHFQQSLARIDVDQIQRQLDSMKYQIQAAEGEVKLLQKNIDQEEQVRKILKNKFTNEQLYQWFVGRLSGQFFQLYQIAYEQALQAQQAWRFEKGTDADYIKGGYWDSLHEGLLAGETLQVHLTQMESAYMQRNKRRFEIEKTISLGQVQPEALLRLREKGECLFELSEDLFDRDYPGHYCRQIASLSVSLPTLIGPYQNIHATLTQLRNSTRLAPDLDNMVLRNDWQVNQQIALSQGVNDSGLFTLNFADERYLPFEGTGAVSVWKLAMPKENNPGVDIDNLTDVIVQLNYTALPGSSAFAKQVKGARPPRYSP